MKLDYDEPLSNLAFKFNLRRYMKAAQSARDELEAALEAEQEARRKDSERHAEAVTVYDRRILQLSQDISTLQSQVSTLASYGQSTRT